MSGDDHRGIEIISHSPEETRALGMRLGTLLGPGDVVCLQGELGTGKTCLTQGIGRGMGVEEIINSPTFVFVNEYRALRGGCCLYHVDLYRIEGLTEAIGLGLEDYMYGDGVTVIEWAERARELLPRERLWIVLVYLGDTRRSLRLQPEGQRYAITAQTLAAEFGAERADATGE